MVEETEEMVLNEMSITKNRCRDQGSVSDQPSLPVEIEEGCPEEVMFMRR